MTDRNHWAIPVWPLAVRVLTAGCLLLAAVSCNPPTRQVGPGFYGLFQCTTLRPIATQVDVECKGFGTVNLHYVTVQLMRYKKSKFLSPGGGVPLPMTAAKNVLGSPITLKAGQRFTRSHRFDGGGVFANERLVTRVLWSDATGYFNEVVTSGG